MTIDARTASPEPSLHAATLLSRTRLTQLECATRLGISERTLRYHLTGRPMSYALRCLFESLAFEMELAHRLVDDFRARFGTDFSKSMGGGGSAIGKLTEGFDVPPRRIYPFACQHDFLREAMDSIEKQAMGAAALREMTPESRAEIKAFITHSDVPLRVKLGNCGTCGEAIQCDTLTGTTCSCARAGTWGRDPDGASPGPG